MADCMDFSSGPSVSFEGPCISTQCWTPTSFASFSNPISTSSFESTAVRTSSSLDLNTHNLYGSAMTASLDSHKTATDLVKDGAFVPSNLAPRYDQGDRQPGEQPKIIVSNDANVTPDYIVRQDGKVEVIGNPDSGDKPHSVYRVQVEPGADQKTTDALVSYLNERIHQKEPSADVSLSAADGLVSEQAASQFSARPNKPDDAPKPDDNPPPEDAPDSPCDPGGGGGGGGGGGDCPNDNTPPEDPPAPEQTPDTPPQPDVAPLQSSPYDNLLDAATLNSWDNNTNGALGAYEVNAGTWFSSWIDDEMLAELGTPPDYRKLGKVLAKHKGDPKFQAGMAERLGHMREQGDNHGADKIDSLFHRLSDPHEGTFAENFGIFLNSQRPGGRNATGEEMNQFFDKDMQKAIASSRMADIAHEAHVQVKNLAPEQAAKMALSGALGHVPSEKEQSDYSKYLQSTQSRYKPNKG